MILRIVVISNLLIYFLFAAIFYLLLCSNINAANWIFVEHDKAGSKAVFYDIDRLKIDKKNKIIMVWQKWQYTKKGVLEELKKRKNAGLPPKDYERLAYSLVLIEYNYEKWKWKINSFADYTNMGEVLQYGNFNNLSKYDDILPESIAEDVLKEVLEMKDIKRGP